MPLVNRRSFLKGATALPVLVPISKGILEADGDLWVRNPYRDAYNASIYIYGTVVVGGAQLVDGYTKPGQLDGWLDSEFQKLKDSFNMKLERGRMHGWSQERHR
jgi:hypothetical protein